MSLGPLSWASRKGLMIKDSTWGKERRGIMNMKKGGLHWKEEWVGGELMTGVSVNSSFCMGWWEALGCALACDFTTNPVCKLLFIFSKLCQTWAFIYFFLLPPPISLLWLALAHAPHIIYDCLWSSWQIIKSRISFLRWIFPLGIGKAVLSEEGLLRGLHY